MPDPFCKHCWWSCPCCCLCTWASSLWSWSWAHQLCCWSVWTFILFPPCNKNSLMVFAWQLTALDFWWVAEFWRLLRWMRSMKEMLRYLLISSFPSHCLLICMYSIFEWCEELVQLIPFRLLERIILSNQLKAEGHSGHCWMLAS